MPLPPRSGDVREAGLEPARPKALDPKSSVSTVPPLSPAVEPGPKYNSRPSPAGPLRYGRTLRLRLRSTLRPSGSALSLSARFGHSAPALGRQYLTVQGPIGPRIADTSDAGWRMCSDDLPKADKRRAESGGDSRSVLRAGVLLSTGTRPVSRRSPRRRGRGPGRRSPASRGRPGVAGRSSGS